MSDSKVEEKLATEVGALLSADMKTEDYYENKGPMPFAESMQSPRYRGYVEANMEKERVPITGPIGLKDPETKRKAQTLVKGRPVRNRGEKNSAQDELMYQGENSFRNDKEEDYAVKARARVQQKTSKEIIKMERAHREMTDYLQLHNQYKQYKDQIAQREKINDRTMLKVYDPFGKPGGGAPMMTKSGRNIPKWKTDKEIRFRDDDYHKRMIEFGNRYRNTPAQQREYRDILADQVEQKNFTTYRQREKELADERTSMKYDPYGKPGCGAPYPDPKFHWSKLEPAQSISVLNEKKSRLMKQAQHNLSLSADHAKKQRQKPETNQVYNPWGKGSGNPRYDNDGNVSVRFGMKTHYDIFNKYPIVTTHSGVKLSGWPLPLENSSGDAIHTTENRVNEDAKKQVREGLLSRRHGENFVADLRSEEKPAEKPAMLNGKEAMLTENAVKPKKHSTILTRVHNESIVGPLQKTDTPVEQGRPSAGKLKRELDQANNNLNMQINKTYAKIENIQAGRPIADSSSTTIPMPTKGKDVADWMRSKAVGQPRRDNSGFITSSRRVTSDVTRHRLDLRTPKNPLKYHEELAEQVNQRRLRIKQEHENDRIASTNWDKNLIDNFGKPGAGAPNNRGFTRRQFSNPSMVPQVQPGTNIPTQTGNNINSHIGGRGHGAPNESHHRHLFPNSAFQPHFTRPKETPREFKDKPTTVASLLHSSDRSQPTVASLFSHQ